MPKSSHSRKGKIRKRTLGPTNHRIRCKFCHTAKGLGHKPGCIGGIADEIVGATTFQYK